jgi:XTP/dITP diphosphohydrolase
MAVITQLILDPHNYAQAVFAPAAVPAAWRSKYKIATEIFEKRILSDPLGSEGHMANYVGPPLLIATNNKGKVKELLELLKDTGLDVVTPAQINLQLDVVEDGNTYAENAMKKAVGFANASGMISLADDSGLEVDILDGAPGLYSARYSPKPNATDADRRAYLLQNLQNKPRPWTARFHATIAISIPNGDVHLSEGICEGEIIPEEHGDWRVWL